MSKTKKIIILLCVFLFIFPLTIINTLAVESNVFNVPIAKPNVSSGFCYLEILYNNKNSVEVVLISVDTPSSIRDEVDLNSLISIDVFQSSVLINPSSYAVERGYSIGVFYVTGHGSSGFFYERDNSITTQYYSAINGVHLYGTHSCFFYNGFNNDVNFVVNYGTDGLAHSQLNTIISILENNNQSIIDNANQNSQQIQQNQNDNTDRVIENQNQLQQNEKDEAQSSGEQSVDDVSGAVEDKSAGFISAVGGLVSAMSYNGTDCSWKFPSLKIPAIAGLMPEYQLTTEQPINFEYWVNCIPPDILLLIRSVLTIGLIVFCFKELYSTISYVLTLKGGSNSE